MTWASLFLMTTKKDRCGYCGKRKSCKTIDLENESIPICEICLLKRNTNGTNNKAPFEAESLEDICKAPGLPDSQYILVIYGDLNEAGAHLSEIKNEEELQRFSNGISKTLDHSRSEIEKTLEQKGFKFLAPVIGGDDIILFTHPASFELIKEHLFRIEKDLEKTGLKMNFSFLLAKHKFPIYHLFKLSQSILDLTKDLYYEDPRKQTRYGFFKVMEGNYRVSNEDVYIANDFKFLFDIARRVHENKDIHTSALYNILELLANDRSLPEKELNLDYFLSRHREFKEYILAGDSDFQLIQPEGKIKLTHDVLEDLIIMKDLLYKPGKWKKQEGGTMTNKIDLTFIPESSFLLGGVSINPAYDSVTALDKNNLPYLTATAIKGALRMEFEAFVRGIGEETLCDFDPDIRGCTTCLSCRLFGGGNEEGKLRFNAAVLENPDEVLPKNIRQDLLEKGKRQGVSISRTLGKAKDKSYFSTLDISQYEKYPRHCL